MYEFHISRTSRDKYQLDHILFAATGNIIFANFHAARKFAQRMNEGRGPARFPERAAQAVRAGEINALGLIDEILHLAIAHYRGEANPQVMAQALSWLEERLGKEKVDNTLHRFTSEFPPLAVYRGELDIPAHLEGSTEGVPNREIALEEMLLLWLANQNPAFQRFDELFDDASLEKYTAYSDVMDGLRVFFDAQLKVGPDGTPGSKPSAQNLIDFLHAPALAAPRSLTTQLEYIHKEWNISQGILYRLLNSLDLIREENKTAFTGPGPALVHEFTAAEGEHERFSLDTEWMPRLVIIAKNTFVWLDQLSQKYGQPITRLDQVPDEELDTLARWGFTGLWLIGLWERSPASRRIKQLTGNPEAIASAYSLYDYTIAGNLGGDAAYQNLRARAHARGVRLAADMVPNHTGIYSKWVLEHPDWYISLDQPPFPTYTFDSPDISENPDIGITLEDHYYERTDAAVVFKRTDRRTGRTDYIYHGNDGTSMPWNDTAQLNYLNPEVREAVIQAILGVARKFPIIRFDAAMTLAKKHFQRLWFPEPGSGGAIPSRAGLGLTRSEMDQAMPKEFWREVVDRIALEVPDTLLLAEAFWLMEGYFVRTLGMHRVYNSAFMNMLRDEKNAEYRQVIKNTLEFDPEILERYVNFMNNPDEETAVTQFGKGGKYFGVCTLMITMPGLSMFGHGQIGGLTEKYGMEYKRAFLDEHPDPGLVARHEREIFPLLHRRRLFAGVENFLLYDFFTPNGEVDENVFAYSNRASGQGAGGQEAGGQEAGGQIRNTEYGIRNTSPGDRALVIYHNKWAETRGWIKTSAAFAVKTGDGEGKTLAQRTLGEGLALTNEEGRFVIFRDHITGLEYIRSNREIHEKGLYVELGAYQYQVFLDFREVQGSEPGEYAALADYLHGRGVPDLEEARKEL